MDWIKNVGEAISKVFGSARKPAPSIPPILMLYEIANRPGLSAIALAAAIISRMEQEGFNTGVNPDGSENMNNKFIRILSEELINEIKNNARVECTVPVGSISIVGAGGNSGGPITITGYNNMITKINGLLK